MSSVRSPDLYLELRTDWRVVAALLAWIGLAVACLWLAALPLAVSVAATVAVLVLGVPALGSQVFGGGREGTVLSWSADGSWHCQRAGGAFHPLELSPVSRVFPGGALLVFHPRHPVHWVLLLTRDRDGVTLRRLRARLTLESRRSGAARPGRREGERPGSVGGS